MSEWVPETTTVRGLVAKEYHEGRADGQGTPWYGLCEALSNEVHTCLPGVVENCLPTVQRV